MQADSVAEAAVVRGLRNETLPGWLHGERLSRLLCEGPRGRNDPEVELASIHFPRKHPC